VEEAVMAAAVVVVVHLMIDQVMSVGKNCFSYF
jgi:hypothetical protein